MIVKIFYNHGLTKEFDRQGVGRTVRQTQTEMTMNKTMMLATDHWNYQQFQNPTRKRVGNYDIISGHCGCVCKIALVAVPNSFGTRSLCQSTDGEIHLCRDHEIPEQEDDMWGE